MGFFDDLELDPFRRRTSLPPFDLEELGRSPWVDGNAASDPVAPDVLPLSEPWRRPSPAAPAIAPSDLPGSHWSPVTASPPGIPGPSGAMPGGSLGPLLPIDPSVSLLALDEPGIATAATPHVAARGARREGAPVRTGAAARIGAATVHPGESGPDYAAIARRNTARDKAYAEREKAAPAYIDAKPVTQQAFDDQVTAKYHGLSFPRSRADSLANARALATYAATLNREHYGGQMGQVDIPSTVKSFEAIRRGALPARRIDDQDQRLTRRQRAEADAVRRAAGADGKISQDELDRITEPSAGQSMGKAEMDWRGHMASALQAGSELLGDDRLARWAGEQAEYYGAIADAIPKGISLKHVRSPDDFIAWTKHSLAGQVPDLLNDVAGGSIGRGLGAGADTLGEGLGAAGRLAPLGEKAGTFGVDYADALGEIEQRNKKVDPQSKAGLDTFLGSGAVALLDTALPRKAGSGLVSPVEMDAAESGLVPNLVLPLDQRLARMAKPLAGQALSDGATGGLQTGASELATALQTGKPIEPGLSDRMLEGAAGGALGSLTKSKEGRESRGSLEESQSLSGDGSDNAARTARTSDAPASPSATGPEARADATAPRASRRQGDDFTVASQGRRKLASEEGLSSAGAPDGRLLADRVNRSDRAQVVRLSAYFAGLPKPDADAQRSMLIGRLGGGETFSLADFAGNWRRLGPNRAYLFGVDKTRDLDRLAGVAERVSGLGEGAPSRDARRAAFAAVEAAIGKGGGARLLSIPGMARRLANMPATGRAARRYWSSAWVKALAGRDRAVEADLLGVQADILGALDGPGDEDRPHRR